MSDRDALLAAVLAAPADDVPRLVYADFLDESGDPGDAGWAALIRVQCRVAGLVRAGHRSRAEVEAELTGERQRAGFDSPPPAGVVCDGSGVSTPGVPCSG